MKHLYKLASLLFFILTYHQSLAQLSITFPTTRAVFQRDLSNQASVHVAGVYTEKVERIEVRLVPIPAGGSIGPNDAVDTQWQTLWTYPGNTTSTPSNGYFQGSVTAKGGWYDLKVRAYQNGSLLGQETTLSKVGVGEVFVIAGQSNATGIADPDNTGPSATYDQVSAVGIGYKITENPDPNQPDQWGPWSYSNIKDKVATPEFVHLDATTTLAPFGLSAWCWGALGDLLVQRWRVPVAFFQGGWSGTGSVNWFTSIDPSQDPALNPVFSYPYPKGQPYGNLRVSLNNYASQYGVRAVLLHQGETDNFANTSQETYVSNWNAVITASRSNSGKENLPWVISRASRYFDRTNLSGPSINSPTIISAQNALINPTKQIFAGPATDDIHGPEYRDAVDVHFKGQGLLLLAKAWADALDAANIRSQATPYAALAPARLYPSCLSSTQMRVKGQDGWASYTWVNPLNNNGVNSVASGNSADFTAGTYQLKVSDSKGNVIVSPRIIVPASLGTVTATINGNTPLSAGHTLGLTAADAPYYSWSGPNGYTSAQKSIQLADVSASQTGTYNLMTTNIYGCTATTSKPVQVITSYTSAQSGNWDDPATWTANCPGCIPTSKTNVDLRPTHRVVIKATQNTTAPNP
ncbi:sialate O-acetylesterase [Siphonobacter curvatus]|uniref:Sialate O-acetylesterase domain-containing protein n=1 Tax=Siphonobacter curvatus TaxID=2094562 RepID=A0A2S7IEJ7_9BACT|nr:sialate O-acetylesterase [Siphonobacter curvatus]PQA52852.1 hypothetical protein C5O19_25580 [Siphonobacter curvatus]